jgi:lactate racemase
MKLRLDFGRTGLQVNVPDKNLAAVLETKRIPEIANPDTVLRESLKIPINAPAFETLAKKARTCCIVVSDKTRPVPNKVILPPLLEIADRYKVQTTILVACGMHTPTEGEALKELLGEDICSRYRIVNHNGTDPNELANLGASPHGVDVLVNKNYCSADLKVLTGFIEPHFMAGFSGGRKAICPGIVGEATMRYAHSAKVMANPLSAPGNISGNPFHEFSTWVAQKAGVDFIVNTTQDSNRNITGIFAGDLVAAHERGMAFCKSHARCTILAPADIVITSNAGFPLDQNFYQTVKGMVTALPAVKAGGTIIIASECSDGAGGDGYREMLFSMKSPDDFNRMISQPGFFKIDQWEVQEQIKAMTKASIMLYSTGINAEDARKCHVEPVETVESGIAHCLKKYGDNATIAVIPSGPYVLPEVEK